MSNEQNIIKSLISSSAAAEALKVANKLLKIDVTAKRCSYLEEENMSLISKAVCKVASLVPKELSELAPGGSTLRAIDFNRELLLNRLEEKSLLPFAVTIPTTLYGNELENALMSDHKKLETFIEKCKTSSCTDEQRLEVLSQTSDKDLKEALGPEAIIAPILATVAPIIASFSASSIIAISAVGAVAFAAIPAAILVPGIVPALIASSLIGAELSTPLVVATLAEAAFQVGSLSVLSDIVDQTAEQVNAMRAQILNEIVVDEEVRDIGDQACIPYFVPSLNQTICAGNDASHVDDL